MAVVCVCCDGCVQAYFGQLLTTTYRNYLLNINKYSHHPVILRRFAMWLLLLEKYQETKR